MHKISFLAIFGQFLVNFWSFLAIFLPPISSITKILTRNTQNGRRICVTEVLKQKQYQSNTKGAQNNGFYMLSFENIS